MTKITLIQGPSDTDWMLCKTLALSTCDMKAKTPPSDDWKKKILTARHSPIRELRFLFYLEDLPSWISVHLVRHVHAQPYVKSQRNDRQKIETPDYDRTKAPQDTPVNMYWSVNAEELMTIANKRLCSLASRETRAVIKQICDIVCSKYPEFKPVLVPNCVAHGNKCYEMKCCGFMPSVWED